MADSLLIRADASGTMGTGHVMRMLALAQAWLDQGGSVHLVSASCPDSLVSRIESEGIQHHPIEGAVGSSDDAQQTIGLASESASRWIVIDGYQFDYAYQKQLKSSGFSLLVVDDFAYEQRWCADAILNQNLFAEDWSYDCELPSTRMLLGSSYVLMRRELKQPVSADRIRDASSDLRLLITLGGGDTALAVGNLLAHLGSITSFNLKARVLIGSTLSSHSELERLARTSRHHIELVPPVEDMSVEYLHADAVISGAGSTCWEWLYYQVPGAVVRMADNQMPVADELVKRHLAVDLGWHEDLATRLEVPQQLEMFLSQVRIEKAKHGQQIGDSSMIVDGKGAERVCDLLAKN